MTLRRLCAISAFLFLIGLTAAEGAKAETETPRLLSSAERQAVGWAADYLARGPESLWDALATHSPLRAIGKDRALAEIETRAGPPLGATWELQTVVPSLAEKTVVFAVNFPSGFDETLILNVVTEAGTIRLDTLAIAAEPSSHVIPPAFPPPPSKGEAGAAKAKANADGTAPAWSVALAIVLLGAALAAAFLLETRRRLALGILAAVATSLAVVLGTSIVALGAARAASRAAAAQEAKEPEPDTVRALASLLALRRSLANSEAKEAEELFAKAPAQGPCADVARLWQAQSLIQEMRLKEGQKLLAKFPAPASMPLAEILRGRLFFLMSKEADAALAYERAIDLGPGRDGLWMEASQAFAILGFENRAKSYLKRLARMGTRTADVYYALSAFAAADNELDEAEKLFRRGWSLSPIERGELFEHSIFWLFLPRPTIYPTLELDAVAEPVVAATAATARPIALPPGAEVHLSAGFLRVAVASAELLVPGGADIAPSGTPGEDAGAWGRAEDGRALGELERLVKLAASEGSLAQPFVRREIERAAHALGERNRWSDVVALTERFSPRAENVPTNLLLLRAEALQRSDRLPDTRALLADLAGNAAVTRRADPGTLLELGEMLFAVDDYAGALRLIEKAASKREMPFIGDRIRQIRTDERLASSYAEHKTEHFRILYPPDGSQYLTVRIGEILEAEYARIKQWIPAEKFEQVKIHLLWYDEFKSTYAFGIDILGFYNGKITIPLAGVPSLVPEIVAILTHELTHAMLAQATNDQAPHWFQEGLAQHVEMIDLRSNPIPDYEQRGRLFSLPVVDGVLMGFPEPQMIEEAYHQAFSLVRFVESQAGLAGIHRLIAAFREGLTTEEALARVLSLSPPQFEERFRDWCRNDAPKVWVSKVKRYDEDFEARLGKPEIATEKKPAKVEIPASLKGKQEWE